jgi:hypothetical protein
MLPARIVELKQRERAEEKKNWDGFGVEVELVKKLSCPVTNHSQVVVVVGCCLDSGGNNMGQREDCDLAATSK